MPGASDTWPIRMVVMEGSSQSDIRRLRRPSKERATTPAPRRRLYGGADVPSALRVAAPDQLTLRRVRYRSVAAPPSRPPDAIAPPSAAPGACVSVGRLSPARACDTQRSRNHRPRSRRRPPNLVGVSGEFAHEGDATYAERTGW